MKKSDPAIYSWKIMPEGKGWRLPIEGLKVSQCIVDCAFLLIFIKRNKEAVVRIESPFTFTDHGKEHKINPAVSLSMAPALKLLNKQIESAGVSENDVPKLTFSEGEILWVEPDPDYEAWTFSCPEGFLAATPGKVPPV